MNSIQAANLNHQFLSPQSVDMVITTQQSKLSLA
eukprot:CAMPEP_0185623844 /NCGR_PEP_ID=MMETSP0436-20130131/60161_1 /TAXON_ID=626734 ORGANISM="Favella taraikaensis, Strain Fe Narragansett Bay" /NCGR_SAMPLE_ID=MMETSP0436 /ASSEMBLY_ACC=CAM_ASM_000390 /LENGTH=33 /DNA_ID= /DNA_START= /DNA_END= /DNA_ORIENTATION=